MSLEPLLHATLVIQAHTLCALVALLVGAVHLFRKNGDTTHRILGRAWVMLMAIVAISGFFIWTIRLFWLFSPIHLLSVFVLVMLWRGVSAARSGDIGRHRRTMRDAYLFGLIITGLLTFIPGRTMYFVAFGPDGATPEKLTIFAAICLIVAVGTLAVMRWRVSASGRRFVVAH
jgi:uncharacterized membrane protein